MGEGKRGEEEGEEEEEEGIKNRGVKTTLAKKKEKRGGFWSGNPFSLFLFSPYFYTPFPLFRLVLLRGLVAWLEGWKKRETFWRHAKPQGRGAGLKKVWKGRNRRLFHWIW